MRKRAILVAVASGVAVFAFLNLSGSSNHGVANFGFEIRGGRQLSTQCPQAIDNTPEDYKELNIPEWLTAKRIRDAGRKLVLKATEEGDSIDSAPPPLAPYAIEDLLEASSLFDVAYGILVYDPEDDDFKLLYNDQKHKWKSPCIKMSVSFQLLTKLLRLSFPDRFRGKESPELVIGIGGGDYPHLNPACYHDYPHAIPGQCNENRSPILQFGTVYRHAEMLPNMIAMPNPPHLDSFLTWGEKKEISGSFNLVQDSESRFEDLIPQVVWRGTDFSYLIHMHNHALRGPSLNMDIESKIPSGMEVEEMTTVAVNTVKEIYDSIPPRWKGVVLTAEAELEAEKNPSSLPWANIKFSRGTSENHTNELAGFVKYGIPALGEELWTNDQASYKYQIDLGGGGGTTWSGTIQKLMMPGLLFHHLTPTKDYIHDRMKPWIHYVPVAADLRDLKEKYDWAEEHPQAAKSIAENGSELMSHLLSPEGMDEMYEQFIVEPMRSVIEAYQPVSVAHPGLSWKQVLKNLEGDSMGLKWRCTGHLKGPNGLKARCTRD